MFAAIPDEVVHDLARRFGMDPARLRRIGGGESFSDGVRYHLDDDPQRLLKVQPRATADLRGRLAAAERLATVDVLAQQGAQLQAPLPSGRGRLMESVDDGPVSYTAYTTPWLPGHALARLARPTRTRYLAGLGRTLGMLHATSRRLPAWRESTTLANGHPVLSWQGEWEDIATLCRDGDVAAVWASLRQELEQLPIERDSFGFCHNDPHLWNVLAHGDRLVLIDLDVATYRWFAADLAMAIWSVTGDGTHVDDLAREQVQMLLDGYLDEYPLDEVALAALPLHMRYRRALLYIVLERELAPPVRDRWRRAVLGDRVDELPIPPSLRLRAG